METCIMIHKKVKLQGEIYWRHENNISPLDHYDESGRLLINPFDDVISYAVVVSDFIMRYGKVIGKVSDLEDIN